MENKILERRVFIDDEQGTVTVFVRLEPQSPRELPTKYLASHAREWLLQNKNIVAGEKLHGEMLRNGPTRNRFGLGEFKHCEGRFVFRLVKDEPKPEPVKPEPVKVKPAEKKPAAKPTPAKKPAVKKTTATRRRRTTKKSKGE